MLKTGRDPRRRLILSAIALVFLLSRTTSAIAVFICSEFWGKFRAAANTLRCKQAILVIAGLLVSLSVFAAALNPNSAHAVTSSNLNFQGRLLTTGGATVTLSLIHISEPTRPY